MCSDPIRIKKIIIAIVGFCIIVSYGIFFILRADAIIQLTREDGIIETATAIFYLLASVVALVHFFGVREGNDFGFFKTKRNAFFLFLGIIFFLIFGEEISWGQRIFGLTTPGFLEEINVQREIGFHNIWVFEGMFRANWLLQYFCFFFAVLLPLVDLTIPRVARWMKKINVPIVPILISLVFVGNYILSRIFNAHVSSILSHSVIEVMELNLGLLFFGVTILFICSLHTKAQRTT